MPYAEINGARLYYQVHGDAKAYPLVLAHGLGGDHTLWLAVTQILARRYRVLLWDCRGHGKSQVTDNGYAIGQFVEDQWTLMQLLGIRRAHVGGLSMGGWIAWSFALAHPDAVSALVLSDSAGYHGGIDPAALNQKRELFEASAKICLAQGRAPLVDATIGLMFSPNFIASNSDTVALVKKQIAADPGVGYARTIQNLFLDYWQSPTADVDRRLAAITAPTLVIAGELDQLTPLPSQQALAAAIPNARLHVLPNAGHVPTIEQPLAWATAALDFLQAVDENRVP